ncbi:MAG: hypothetical protein KGS72_16915 [Cyanobacteria bacterium REEB67]|nr:hypothetical protein [Cyanobacteria bacterium REEB67]
MRPFRLLSLASIGIQVICAGATLAADNVAQPPEDDVAAQSTVAPGTGDAGGTAGATESYPHIGALEKAILKKDYVGEALSARLARMEAKAFGKASVDPDLSLRTDNLEDYAQKVLHQKPWGAGSAYDVEQAEAAAAASGNTAYPDPGGGPGIGTSAGDGAEMQGSVQTSQAQYPHITALETGILGQTYTSEALPDRLTRMELKAFGSKSSSQDYSDRTDALENYATKKLHKKPFVQEQKQEAASSGGGAGGGGGPVATQNKLLNFVGNSLLSMAGVGRIGGPVMGGNPGLNAGMGGGVLPGFSGVRMRPRSGQQGQAAEAPVDLHPEDPSVHDANPPAAEAKTLTKVGWCEVQIFGHTSPNLHLGDRLQALNKELNFAPGKTSLELMDNIGALIKAVQTRKKTTGVSAPTH